MRNFQDTFETRKWLFISAFSICMIVPLTLSWRMSLSSKNKSTDLLWKSMDWFRYDKDFRHESICIFGVIEGL